MPRKFDFISPGIQITEVDQSILPAEVDADGPIIIGRTAKGPAMKPVKVRSLADYISVFGAPNPGGDSPTGDLWRDGVGSSAPSYASYAAQAWLAGGTSPVTMVRLLGEDHPNASTEAGKAGWKLNTAIPTTSISTNSTAYGLFIVDSANTGQLTFQTIQLTGNPDDTKKVTIQDSFATSVEFKFNAGTGVSESASVREIVVGGSAAATAAVLANKIEEAITLGFLSGIVVSYDAGDNTVEVATTHLSTPGSAQTDNDSNIDIGGTGAADPVPLPIATATAATGALAAVLYANKGGLGLYGNDAAGSGEESKSGRLTVSSAAAKNQFTLAVFNDSSSAAAIKNIEFNFDRNSEKYIRKVLNTDPTLTNSDMLDVNGNAYEYYFLGETFERILNDKVTSTGGGNQQAILLPMHKDIGGDGAGVATHNWSYRKEGAQYAKSGWVFSQDFNDGSTYDPLTAKKMFRICAIQEGEHLQREILIAFCDLKLPTNSNANAYSTFTVKVMNTDGASLEEYAGCNMDPSSPNFVARRVGDMYMEWDDTKKRYYSYGDYQNVSDYIRIEMAAELPSEKEALPFGFFGPGRPKGFGIVKGDTTPKTFDLSSDFSGSFIANTGVSAIHDDLNLGGAEAVKFEFPSLPVRTAGSQGFVSNQYQAMYGVRPKIGDNSNAHDPDYADYVRRLPATFASHMYSPSGDFEYSFYYSLDELVIDDANAIVTYTSGSRRQAAGPAASYTKNSGSAELLKLGVKQWAMPIFGGFDGLDAQEREPFRFGLVESAADSGTDTTDDLTYTLNKAIASVDDGEQLPANLLVMPGITDDVYTSKLISVAEKRQDCLAIIDLEGDYRPKVESAYSVSDSSRRGSVTKAVNNMKSRNLNSSYGCAFYPWIQVRDTINSGELVWLPPSIAALGAMARTEASSDLWFAPAGFNRGGLSNLGGSAGPLALQARQKLDSSDRDDLYASHINPIATFPNEGLVIFGQKTLQVTPSALDRINVRRLMIFLKRQVGEAAKSTLFQNNVEATWNSFKGNVEPILSSVKSRFGLTDYQLVLDETTTTPDLIDRNILYAKVFLKPARAIEYIAIDFVITRTGAEFA